MSTFEQNTTLQTLKPYNYSALLQLEENGCVTATADVSTLKSPYVYFYVEVTPDFEANELRYQFKPYCQSHKYIAVVDGKVVLKTESECTKSERMFYIDEIPGGYLSFYLSAEGTTYYLGCKNDKKLCACAERKDEASWFIMQKKDDETILPEKANTVFTVVFAEE